MHSDMFLQRTTADKLLRYPSSKWRGTEVAITALTRNQMVRVTWHVGSNPTLSANSAFKLVQLNPINTINTLLYY